MSIQLNPCCSPTFRFPTFAKSIFFAPSGLHTPHHCFWSIGPCPYFHFFPHGFFFHPAPPRQFLILFPFDSSTTDIDSRPFPQLGPLELPPQLSVPTSQQKLFFPNLTSRDTLTFNPPPPPPLKDPPNAESALKSTLTTLHMIGLSGYPPPPHN